MKIFKRNPRYTLSAIVNEGKLFALPAAEISKLTGAPVPQILALREQISISADNKYNAYRFTTDQH